MKKQNIPRATPDEWERRLASILDKSRASLVELEAKYERRSKRSALWGIEKLHCGPHERSAIEAFRAKVSVPLSRPLSRSSDDEVNHSVGVEPRITKYVDDKLVVKARAIDALRDQITALSDDIRQLTSDSTRTAKAVTKQERKLDLLSAEFDTRQGNFRNIAAGEKDWKAKIESDLGTLLQTTRQQKEQLDNKANLTSLNAILESVKSDTSTSIASAVSPLQTAIKREMQTLRERMKEEVSVNIQPFQANLLETTKVAVERETKLAVEKELERLQGCISSFEKSKGRVQAFVTSAVDEAEKNLQGEINASLKEVKRLQKDVGLLRRSIRDDVATDLTTLREEISQLTMKQSEFMPALNASIESCRRELSNIMVEGLSEVISEASSRSKVVDDTLKQIGDVQKQHREELTRQANDISSLFQRLIELEANLLEISRQHQPYDDNTLSEKVNSLVNAKMEKWEEKMKALENSQSAFNIKESEVWRESLQLLKDEESRRRSIRGLMPLDEEEEDKLNISEERNRTLSDVAKSVLVVASKRNDPSLIELAQRIRSGKIVSTPHQSFKQVIDYSPSETSISTTEALSLCGVKLDQHDEVETPRRESPSPQPFPSRSRSNTPSPRQSCLDSVLNTSNSDVNVHNPPLTAENEKEEEVTQSQPNKTPKPSGKETGYNPTRLSNPEPYEGWDSLLTELRASGLVLRDGNEDNTPQKEEEDESSCSYGSDSFE